MELPPPQLHVIDLFNHEHTTAHIVLTAADKLGLTKYVTLHNTDAFVEDLPQTLAPEPEEFGFIWIDLGEL